MRDIVLALFILGTVPFILMRPYIGLLVWSWLGYMNPHRLTWGFAYDFPWVMIIALLTLASLFLSKENKAIPKTSISFLLLGFLAWTGITTVFAVEPAAAADKLEQFAKTLVMVYVTLILVNDRRRMHILIWVVVVSLGFYGLKGGLFTVLKGGVYHVLGPPGSFIADNNALALALCMTLPLTRYLQLHSARRSVRIALGVGMVLIGVAILGTYSRGGLVGLVVVSVALFLKSRHRISVALALAVVVAVAFQFMPAKWTARMDTLSRSRQVNSFQTRMQSWQFATNVAIHHPLTGGGFEDYRNPSLWVAYGPEEAEQRAIHSIYFRVLGEQGVPGLILFLILLVVSWRNCRRVRKKTRDVPEQRWAYDLASMLQVTLAAFMAAGAGLPMSYFDLTFQLMALCALLDLHVRQLSGQQAIEPATDHADLPPRTTRPHQAMPE